VTAPNLKPRRCEAPGCRHRSARRVGEQSLCIDHGHAADHAARLTAPAEEAPLAVPALPRADRAPCLVCASRRVVLGEEDGLTVAVRCAACEQPCAVCKGVGSLLVERQSYSYQVPCACETQRHTRAAHALTAARLPGAYAPLLFGKLPTPPAPLSPSQVEAHRIAHGWAGLYVLGHRPGLAYFFHGPAGTGKTLALCRLLARIAVRRGVGRFVHWPSYLASRKDSFKGGDAVEAVAELVAAPVLVVDEILLQGKGGAARSMTDWERAQFDLLVHGRWSAGQPTHYATNYTPEQIEAEVSESTWSRIRSSSHTLEVTGPDLRQRSTHRSSQ
jgi:hypothetical protein